MPELLHFSKVEDPKYEVNVDQDKHTTDDKLKLKLRDLNLIKHNPNLFTNRGEFFDVYGGSRSLLISSSFALAFYLYRKKANSLRGIKIRHGVIYNNVYAFFGFLVGNVYAASFFTPTQRLANDYNAQFLFKRYKDSKNLNRSNIWAMRDHENDDECYHFTSSYFNTFHF
jgi:hypothetical protein